MAAYKVQLQFGDFTIDADHGAEEDDRLIFYDSQGDVKYAFPLMAFGLQIVEDWYLRHGFDGHRNEEED